MERTEPCILTNMVMVQDHDRLLVQRRTDPMWPGLTFPGGHIEPGESVVQSAVREVREETGLNVENLRLCGVKQWTQPGKYRYLVFYFKTQCFSGTLRSSDEGEVFWVPRAELFSHSLADGFADMLRVFEDDTLNETYFYPEDGQWRLLTL